LLLLFSFCFWLQLHDTVRLSVLDSIALFEKVEVSDIPWSGGDQPLQGCHLPLSISSRQVHTACVTLNWVDQEWGNRKGRLYVVATPWPPMSPKNNNDDDNNNNDNDNDNNNNNDDNDNDDNNNDDNALLPAADQPQQRQSPPWRGGRLVYESPIAEHSPTDLRLEFPIREGERYHLWYKAGGGGGHTLTLKRARATFLVFDEADGCVRATHRALLQAGVLPGLPPSVPVRVGASRITGPTNIPHRSISSSALTTWATPTPPVPPSSLYPRLLVTVCQSLRRQWSHGETGDPALMALLAEHGIQLTDRALQIVEELMRNAQD